MLLSIVEIDLMSLGDAQPVRSERREVILRLLILWFAGISLRLTVLAVPPLLTTIHARLHLTESAVGALTALPVVVLALAAVPGSWLVARFGARRALLVGLVVVSVAGAIRPIGPSTSILFASTLLMGCGVAICQPSMPSLVRAWVPGSIGLATATYSNGMLIGEIVPVILTAPLLVDLVGGWQPALSIWSVPVILAAVAVLIWTRDQWEVSSGEPAAWWPDWKDGRVWVLGLTLGGASAAYWSGNAFIPELLQHRGQGEFIAPALTALNLVQLPASFAVALSPDRFVARSWPLAAAGVTTIVAALGIAWLPSIGLVIAAGLLGLSTAWIFVLTLAVPPLISKAGDTHRMSAGVFTISYLCPFVGGLLGGGLWDSTGIAQTALVPVILGGVMMLVFPPRLKLAP